MNKLRWILLASIFIITQACSDYQRPANGRFFEVVVMMDSSQQKGALADTIRAVFEREYETLPTPEAKYVLNFKTIKTQDNLEVAKRSKNLIIAATLNEKSNVGEFLNSILDEKVKDKINQDEINAIHLDNKWYSNQWILLLSGSSQEKAAAYLSENQEPIVESLDQKERERWVYEIYEKGRQTKVEDSLWTKYGWKIGIQHDYQKNIDDISFVSFRRYMANNDRWIWVWWQDNMSDLSFLDSDWINQKRDSLSQKYIRGNRGDSYVKTEFRRPVLSKTKLMNGRYTIQTNGTWTMVNDFMGGPFVNYTIYDEHQRRLYMLEFSQFAPKLSKRTFVRQFEAMGLTFDTDSTFTYPELEKEDK